jgi:hypothetical protein
VSPRVATVALPVSSMMFGEPAAPFAATGFAPSPAYAAT